MAQYLSYEEYLAMGGGMDAAAYPLAELRARKRIDALTLGRAAGLVAEAGAPEEVKAAMMEIMAVDATWSAAAQAQSPVAESFSTDGYSESYGSARERAEAAERRLNAGVEALLAGLTDKNGVPLIYAGVPTAGEPGPGGTAR